MRSSFHVVFGAAALFALTNAPRSVLPADMCDSGRETLAPALTAFVPLLAAGKDVLGPIELTMCGEQKTVPGGEPKDPGPEAAV
jgi:hypothetical protein